MEELINQDKKTISKVLDLSIIIVNWKSRNYLERCLNSIYSCINQFDFEIIVVDNASFDGSKQLIRDQFEDVNFVQLEKNLGFGGANNIAFRMSQGNNVLFLNPDTFIMHNAIDHLLAVLKENKDAGLVGARLLNENLTLQTTCITEVPGIFNQLLNLEIIRSAFPQWRIWGMQAFFRSDELPVRVHAISGACMMGRQEAIKSVGAFSDNFFMYAEDMDLCVKIRRAGWKVYHAPNAKIIHYGGGSSRCDEVSNLENIRLQRSMYAFFKIHNGIFYANFYRTSLCIISLIRITILFFIFLFLAPFSKRKKTISSLNKWMKIMIWSIGLDRSIK